MWGVRPVEVREAAARPVVWRAWAFVLEGVGLGVVVEVEVDFFEAGGLEAAEEIADSVRDILSLLEARASGLMSGNCFLGLRIEAPLPRAAALTLRDGSFLSRCCSGVAVSAPS